MTRTPLHYIGMYGIGDCVHQRAVLKSLLPNYDIWLETCHAWIHLDLIEQYDVKLVLRQTRLWGHWQNIAREREQFPGIYRSVSSIPRTNRVIRNWYHKHEIDRYGSILDTMMRVAGLPSSVAPDFTLPVRSEWRDEALRFLEMTGYKFDRPLMVYRPVVYRREWPESKRRNPDWLSYASLYRVARQDFFVVSLAYLGPEEQIVGAVERDVDFTSHDGALSMAGMAALIAEADAVFCCAGNAPVLAQAVGTPSITVYGGRENYDTTQRAGAHLAPTLGIDPIVSCKCHGVMKYCPRNCNKTIDIPEASRRIREFIDNLPMETKQWHESTQS